MKSDNTQRRTMIAFTLQGIFFFIGYCFVDVNTVIPVFIQALTGREELAGLASTIRQFSTMFFQIAVGAYVVKVKNVTRYLSIFLVLSYIMPLMLALPLLAGVSGGTMAALTFAAIAIMWISDGFFVIGYYDLLGRTVSGENRARVLGYQQLIGGAGAVLAAYVVKRLMDMQRISFYTRYSIIFALGGGIMLLGAISMMFARDVKHRIPDATYSFLQQFKQMMHTIKKNSTLRKILLCQALFLSAMMVAPYVLLLCMEKGGASDTLVSTLLSIQVMGTLIGGCVSAFLAPKLGNPIIVLVYCILCVVCCVFGLLTSIGVGVTIINMVLTAVTAGIAYASWAGFMNVIIDVSKGENTHSYMLANSVISLPLAFCTLIAGQIVKHFGYSALFATAAVLAMCAFTLAVAIVKENTHERRQKQ